jgi:hypothetical protein
MEPSRSEISNKDSLPEDAMQETPEQNTPVTLDASPLEKTTSPSWVEQLARAKQSMADRISTGEKLPFRVNEFWAEASWPLHTIEADLAMAEPSGDFVTRLAKQGLTPAMNVIVHRKSNHHVGAVFGPYAYNMSYDYGNVEALLASRKKAIEEGQSIEEPDDEDKKLSKSQKMLKGSAYGAGIDLEEKKEGPKDKDKYGYLRHLEKKAYPTPDPIIEPEAWTDAGSDARSLCEKFGLRAVNIPLSFNASEAKNFIGRLDSALTQLADFVGVEPTLLGLDQWLGLRARAPGERDVEEASATEDAAALAEKEKAAALKKKSDSEHGMFMGGFIQIEVSPNFEPVVLAHEWFHSLDLWFGSREIVAKQPWHGWSVFGTQVAFTNYEQSPKLREWREQLVEGGPAKVDYLDPVPAHSYLSQMRFDKDEDPEGEFQMPMGRILAARLMRAFKDLPMDPERKATTSDQAEKLGEMIAEAAKVHALDHRNSAQTEESLERRRKEFYAEWGDLAAMWSRRQAGDADPKALDDMEARMRSQVLGTLAGAWNWARLEKHFSKPDVHSLQALRMDVLSGRMSPYFSTPHEMFAYKLEELFVARGQPIPEEDKVGAILSSWLREEAVPALREARAVSFSGLMGVKTKSPTP